MQEGDPITVGQLKNEWSNVLSKYDQFIQAGNKLRPIRFIVRHIMDRGYDSVLFPGTSMYSLLISIPLDDRVNFSKTLKIEFDHLTEKVKFRYNDGTDPQSKWEETCQATEGIDLLEHFLTANTHFSLVTKKPSGER